MPRKPPQDRRQAAEVRARDAVTRQILPSDLIVHLPGGTAHLRHPERLTERYRRPLRTAFAQIPTPRLKAIMSAGSDDLAELEISVELTEREANLMMRMNDAAVYALLESWTLPGDLPGSVDAVQDLDTAVYDALVERVAPLVGRLMVTGPGVEIVEGEIVDTFTVAGVEDPASPTGASAC